MSDYKIVSGVVLTVVAMWCSATEALPIAWNSTNYEIGGDSIVGRSSVFSVPGNFSSIESRDMRATSGATLPVPGPSDTDNFGTSVSLGFPGSGNARGAGTGGRTFGDPTATLTLFNEVGAGAVNNSISNSTIKSQATGTTTFEGEFVSTGSTFDFSFDGIYDLFSFHQNGAAASPQRAESSLSAVLTVDDLTAGSGITSETVFSDSLIRASFGVSRKDDVAFSGTRSIDLAGTSGHTIKATFTTTAGATSYAGRYSHETQSATGAQSAARFDELNFAFDQVSVPGLGEDEPVMPDMTQPDGTKVFNNPDQANAFIPPGAQNAGLWFDPPPTSALQLTATEGLFLELGVPASYPDSNGEYRVVAPGVDQIVAAGGFVTFGSGVSSIVISDIDPTPGGGQASGFPFFLATDGTSWTVALVPEPLAFHLAALGLLTLVLYGSRREK